MPCGSPPHADTVHLQKDISLQDLRERRSSTSPGSWGAGSFQPVSQTGRGRPAIGAAGYGALHGCQLVQLQHSVAPGELYTHHYGYRSDTNVTMRKHFIRVAACVRGPSSPESRRYRHRHRLQRRHAAQIVLPRMASDASVSIRLPKSFGLNTRPTSGFTKDFSRLPPVAACAAENTPRP